MKYSMMTYTLMRQKGCFTPADCVRVARELGMDLANDLLDTSCFYLELYEYSSSNFEGCHRCLMYLADVFKQYGDKDLSDRILDSLELLVRVATGDLDVEEDSALDTITVAE